MTDFTNEGDLFSEVAVPETGCPLLGALKQYYGFDAFLDGQEEVVQRVAAGEDLCVVMPTGAGKSLCYQLPTIAGDGYGLVISPLISLMKDQVDALKARGISAACVNSSIPVAEQREIMDQAALGHIKLLYVAPERLRLSGFREMVRRMPPSRLIIDEAHCVSQWGHDFRPDYARIGAFVDELKIPQVCAFTATATPVVREDIVAQLHRPEMPVYVTGFTRPNLHFSVEEIGSQQGRLDFVRRKVADGKPTIIYASTRSNVDDLVSALKCVGYHAGMDDRARHAAQDRFMNDAAPVVAATNAFGMGIDRSDVRRVIHYNVPGSLESYYQEAGRAGRDGEDAECILLFSHQDRHIHEFLIDLNNPSRFIVQATWQALRLLAKETGSNQLEIPVMSLAERITGAKGDAQISAALKVLERNGLIARGYRGQNRGFLRANRPFEQLLAAFPEPTTQRAVFLHRVAERYGRRLEAGIETGYSELCGQTGLNDAQLKRVLRALAGNEIVWTPPFSGRSITVCKPDEFNPDIDFTEMEHHAKLERQRLADMMNFPNSHNCRQQYIIRYFGQDAGEWRCGVCDHCVGITNQDIRAADEGEQQILKKLLQCVEDLGGRYGKQRVAKFAIGSKSQDIMDSGLHHRPSYATVSLSQPATLKLLDTLAGAGLCQVIQNNKYPLFGITPSGRAALQSNEALSITIPADLMAQKTASRSSRAAEDIGEVPDDLYETLRELRNKKAVAKNIPPYQILSNDTLRRLAVAAPATKEEALKIKGIGPVVARRHLPPFLEAISAWRQAQTGT